MADVADAIARIALLDREIERLARDVDQALRSGNARVVDQDIDRAGLGLCMRNRSLDAGIVGHVQADHMGSAAVGFDLGPQFLQALDAARS